MQFSRCAVASVWVLVDRSPPQPNRADGQPVRPPAVVLVEGVSKTFRLPHQQYTTLKERVLHPWRTTEYDELRALRDVSLEISEGEFFGIVGRNGSGKSTLLKCIAGIYRTDTGRIVVDGRLSPFIELGVGFNMDLNARDNVLINAIMLGLSRRQAQERFEHVVAFAELEEFMDLRLKNYSSGMLVRLAFAIAIQVDAEILLIDEVFAVGDAAFQQKCYDEFFRLKREGKTVIFVSHDMYSIERFCDRAMLIEHGVMTRIGDPHQIGRAYHELNFGQLAHVAPVEHAEAAGTVIVDAWFEDEQGERVQALSQEERLVLCFEARFGEDLHEPVFAATLRNQVGATIIVARSDQHGDSSVSFSAGQSAIARFALPGWLAASRYSLTPSLAREGTGESALALVEDMTTVVVHGDRGEGGLLAVPVETRLERL